MMETIKVGDRVKYWRGVKRGEPSGTSRVREVGTMGKAHVVWLDGEAACIAMTHVELVASRDDDILFAPQAQDGMVAIHGHGDSVALLTPVDALRYMGLVEQAIYEAKLHRRWRGEKLPGGPITVLSAVDEELNDHDGDEDDCMRCMLKRMTRSVLRATGMDDD
jgi:hypothetical protein